MTYFLKSNKSLTYTLVIIAIISTFGLNFFISFLSNILLLLLLIPLFLLLIIFIGLNSFKSKINTCSNCGTISLGLTDTCMNCGEELKDTTKNSKFERNPSEKTIEVKAEEVK